MKANVTSKRSYHPLVQFFYSNGLLNTMQLDSIPSTTIAYWNKHSPESMYGFEWVSGFSSDLQELSKTQKHKIISKAARLCIKTLNCFSSVIDQVGNINRLMKKNAAKVIDTIDYLTSEMPLGKACQLFRISTSQYYRWKNKVFCSASVLNLCYKTHPHQLTIGECSEIKEAVNDPANERKKLASIWHKLMRDGKLYCSRSTFYKYSRLVSEFIKKKKYNKQKETIISTHAFEFVHVDTTFLPTIKDGSVRAVIIKDNYSKKNLHWGIAPNGDSKWVAKLLQEMFLLYGLHNHEEQITLVSDGGSENKGDVIEWIDGIESPTIIKQIAKTKEFSFTNNEIESTFNIFKNEFLGDRNINDEEQARKLLSEFQLYNDNERYPIALYGLTPQEVFDGFIIDKNRFKNDIKQTAKSRHLKNKSGKFCDICSER